MSETVERTVSGLTVRIERDLCISTVACTRIAPEVLELDDQRIVTFRQDAADIDRDRLVEACQVCPVQALAVFDEAGQQLV